MSTSDVIILHVIGLPHTVLDPDRFSTCAFSMKALNLCNMFADQDGFIAIDYSNEGSTVFKSKNTISIPLYSKDELDAYINIREGLKTQEQEKFTEEWTKNFYAKAMVEMQKTVSHLQGIHICCHVFGPELLFQQTFPDIIHCETGIGYNCGIRPHHQRMPYRVFESFAWMHYHWGGSHVDNGRFYDRVIPNYYKLKDWKVNESPAYPDTVLFFGRVIQRKGIQIIADIAKNMPLKKFLIVGKCEEDFSLAFQGCDNVEFRAPVTGKSRSDLLRSVGVMISPTLFIEPFCGSATESMLCGTPVVATAYGVFTEKIQQGINGFTCQTLGDFIAAINIAPTLNRRKIANNARKIYSISHVRQQYIAYFRSLQDVKFGKGWYSLHSHDLSITGKLIAKNESHIS